MADANEKWFSIQEAFVPNVEHAAHALGESFAKSGLFAHLAAVLPESLMQLLGQAVMLAGGVFNVPRHVVPVPGAIGDALHRYLNDFIDAFVGGIRDGLKAGDGVTSGQVVEAAAKAAEAVREKPMWLVLETLHSNEGCSVIAQYKAATTSPARKGKDGADLPAQCRAVIVKTTLEQGIREGRPLCPICNRDSIQAPGATKKAEEAPKPPKPKSLPELIAEIEGIKPDADGKPFDGRKFAAELWKFFHDGDDLRKQKMVRLAASADGLAKLKAFDTFPNGEWDDVLNAALGSTNQKVESLTRAAFDKLGKLGEKIAGRAASEENELKAVVNGIGDGIDAIHAPIKARIETLKAREEARKRTRAAEALLKRRNGRIAWRFVGLALMVAAMVAAVVIVFGR